MALQLLVLEDDHGIRTALCLAMEDEGYEVLEASSAESALVLVGRTHLTSCWSTSCWGRWTAWPWTDDYVTKPSQVKEIEARRRPHPSRAASGCRIRPLGRSRPPEAAHESAPRQVVVLGAAATVPAR